MPGAASAGPQNPAGEEHVGEGVVSAEETCGGEEEAAAEVEEAEKHEAEDEDEDKVVALAGLAQLPRLSRLELSDWPLLDYDDLEVHCNPPPLRPPCSHCTPSCPSHIALALGSFTHMHVDGFAAIGAKCSGPYPFHPFTSSKGTEKGRNNSTEKESAPTLRTPVTTFVPTETQ